MQKIAHILFIVENNTVPPDIRVWREAKAARDAGFEVTIIAPAADKFRTRHENTEGIEIYRHPGYENHNLKHSQIFEYLNAFFWELYLSFKIFAGKPFQLIHAANPPDNVFLIALIYKVFGSKFIFDHHDLAPELYRAKYKKPKGILVAALNLLEKFSCKVADVIIATNHSFKNHIIDKYKIAADQIYVVRNDPELNAIQNSSIQNISINQQSTNLLYVGAINTQDGVDSFIKVVDILVNRMGKHNLSCRIVGDGDCLEKVKKLAIDLKVENYFEFTGYIYNRELLKRYINEADICLETAPENECNRRSTFIKVMEYMAMGKPIVAFDLPETRVSVGETAILVAAGDLMGLATSVVRLTDNPELRTELGALARKRIENGLNWETSKKELIRAYHFIIL